MPNLPTASERWFDQYLSDHGYTVTPEPDLGIPTLPDRLIERDGTAAICEVKEFRSDALRRRWPEGGSQVSTFSSAEWLASVRRAIREAARQLQPLAGDRRPLVIVLANPHGVAVDLDGRKLMEAMQGQLTIQIPMGAEAGQLTEEPRFVLGDDGRLAGDQAPWVGAVVGLHRGDREQDWARSWIEQWKAEHWPLEAWLWRIVINVARDETRRSRVAELSADELAEIAPVGNETSSVHDLRDELRALPDRQRLAVFLHYYANLPYEEVAGLLDIAPGTVGASLNAARKTLRRRIKEAYQ